MPQEAINKAYQRLSEKFDMPPIEQFQESLKDQDGRKKAYDRLSQAFDMSEVPFETFDRDVSPGTEYPFHGPKLLGAALTGFGQSNVGAEVAKLRGTDINELSQFQPSSLSERIAMSAGKLAGDLPSMFAGGLVGTLGGLVTGPGAVLSGGAGAFALPRTIEAVQRGETFQEALPEVGKSAALGALTAGVGGVVGKVAPALKLPAEIGALTLGGAGLEGRLPTSDDIIEATALVYGFKFANSLSRKIRKAKIENKDLNVDDQLSAISNIINQQAKDPKWQIPPEQLEVKLRLINQDIADRALRRSQKGAELLKRDLAVKEILGEPGAPPASDELIKNLQLLESKKSSSKVQPKTQEQRLQERAEDAEIQAAISREKVRQKSASSDEEFLLSKGYSPEAIKDLKAKSGSPSTREIEASDFASNKEAMLKAAEQSQQQGTLPEAIKETLKGLGEILKPSGELRSGVGFSEESYQKAKPHFQEAWKAYKSVGFDFIKLVDDLRAQYGDKIVPMLYRFYEEGTPTGKITVDKTVTTEMWNKPYEEIKPFLERNWLGQQIEGKDFNDFRSHILSKVGTRMESHLKRFYNDIKDFLSESERPVQESTGRITAKDYQDAFSYALGNYAALRNRTDIPSFMMGFAKEKPSFPGQFSPENRINAIAKYFYFKLGIVHDALSSGINTPAKFDAFVKNKYPEIKESKLEFDAYEKRISGLDIQDSRFVGKESNLIEGTRAALKGIQNLFDSKSFSQLNTGIGFSEEAYQKAKPHFQKAWEAYKAAGRDFRDFTTDMLEKGGENVKPFLDQFQREQAAAVKQNFTQQTTERTNQASQSKPEERVPQVEDIQWLSRILFTPQRAVSTKLRSGFGKTNIEVNLENPRAQDIAYKVFTQDSKTSQSIQTEISHATNTETEFYKGISRLPQGLSSRVYSAEKAAAGAWLQRTISNPTELRKVPLEYKQTVTSLLAHYKMTDAQVKGDPARGIPGYVDLMTQAGASKQAINAGLRKLQLADIRFRGGKDVFKDFKGYLAFVNRHLLMDPVQAQVKNYMKDHPELFPTQIRQTIEEQLLVSRGEKSWIEDRFLDGAIRLLSGKKLEPHKSFTQFSQSTRKGEANLKLGYRPVSAFVDLVQSVINTTIKREGQPFFLMLKRTIDFMKSPEGKKYLLDEEQAGSLQLALDVDYAGRPIPKEKIWKPLGIRSKAEVDQRKFSLAFAYQVGLATRKSEPVAREFARRMNHLTQGTAVLSGMRHFMRMPFFKSLFQFKEYLGRTFEMMHTFSKREWAEWIFWQGVMAGPKGLIHFVKSIPMLALLGVLDEIEDALNTYKGIGKEFMAGLPGAAGADISAQATLQLAPEAQDAGGVLISDAIKIFKNFILPVLGPGKYLTARAIKEFGGDTLKSVIPQFRNVMDIWDSVVDDEGWVKDNEGKPKYQLNSVRDRVIKGLGGQTTEESHLRVAERLKARFEQEQRDSIKFLLRVAAKDKLTGSDAAEAVKELSNLGIQSQSIENALKQRLLDPKTRALLKARLSQKAKALEFYDFE